MKARIGADTKKRYKNLKKKEKGKNVRHLPANFYSKEKTEIIRRR